MAQSYRDPNATAESSEAGTGDAADADVALLENTVQAALASFEQSVGALEDELAAELGGSGSSWLRLPGTCRTAKLSSHPRHG